MRTPIPPLLDSRRFLVTGGSRGLGAEIVSLLASHGATGTVLDLHLSETEPPAGWTAAAADVTKNAQMKEVIDSLIDAHGPFDGLVAAAGIVPSWHSPATIDLEMLDRVMAVNLHGLVGTLKCVTPSMPRGSTVVAIGSLNSWRGDANLLAYVASKHAVLGAVRSAALALGTEGIRVNAVAPGPVATEALRSRISARSSVTGLDEQESLRASAAATALGRLATENDIAQATLFLSSAMSAAITGQILPVDGGLL